jgi:hypothetical protein
MVKKLVLVDAISQYRMTYAIEVEDDIEHALDVIACREITDEMSQEWLGETIFSHREITPEEYIKIFDERNDYLRSWTDEQKRKYIYRIDYTGGSVDE